jgi:lipopolysaccharide transport system ATP-binding protein
MSDEVLVRVENVRKKFCRSLKRSMWYGMKDVVAEVFGGNDHDRLRKEEFWALDDVSFDVSRGQCIGLIGRNGAGKTTLLKMLNGLIKPDHGTITMRGRIGALIALGAGFNPILSGRENIYVNGSVLGLTKAELDEKIDEIIDFAEIREFIDAPVQSYSSGMAVRLGFAVATALKPDIIILDEVLAVGDASFRNKCYRRISELREKAAIIFVSHQMEQVSRICDKALALAQGKQVFFGGIAEGVSVYEKMNDDTTDGDDSFLSFHEPVTAFSVSLRENKLQTGAPLTLDIEVTCSALFDPCLLRLLIYNANGGFAADCNYQTEFASVKLTPGTHRWTIVVDSIPLRTGNYRFSLSLIDSKGGIVVWSHKQHSLRIDGAYAGANADCQLRLRSWVNS